MENRAVDKAAEEIAKEKAEALGLSARALEAALGALREHDERHGSSGTAAHARRREELVANAAERVLYFIVQREAQGLRDANYVFDFYGVPPDVVERIGASPRATAHVSPSRRY